MLCRAARGARRFKSDVVDQVAELVQDPAAERDLKSFVEFYKTRGKGTTIEDILGGEFDAFDGNSDGVITRQEYVARKLEHFEAMDTNKNSVVERSEFDDYHRGEALLKWWKLSAHPDINDHGCVVKPVEAADTPSPDEPVPPPTRKQLLYRSLKIGIPMVVFGFSDNFFMILGGEAVDIYVGKVIGLSTLAAAGIGNMVSDIIGLSLSKTVEDACDKLGIPSPKFTPAQARLPIVRAVSMLSSIIGIVIGCTLGLVPLLFFGKDGDSESDDDTDESAVKAAAA